MMHRWGMVACALALAACELTEVAGTMVALPPDGMPDPSAPSGSFNLLIVPVSVPNFGDPLEMVENGIPIYAGSGTSDASSAPAITNQPADLSFLGTDSVRTIELDYTDPNGETPAFYFVVSDPTTGRMYPHCVWMTHAERDMIRQGVVKLKAGITGYVDFGSGFYQGSCNALPPFHSRTTPPGGVERCPTGFFACGPGCLPNGMSCGPGDGESGCASGQHLCLNRGPQCTAQPCCDYFSPDPSCCPNGPMSPPCLPPNVAGDPVRIATRPTAPPAGGGGIGPGGGGGGGDTETWLVMDPGGNGARITISPDGTIASSGTPQWTMKNNAGDCSFPLPISGKMTGSSWSFTFGGSGCGNFSLTGSGSGSANGDFGVASTASGTLHETANSPLGPVTNDGPFSASRTM
jgi:hypothetical protein